MSELKIATVVNDFEIFNRCIKNNENLKTFEVIAFDNTVENKGIPERYNSFISSIKENDDYWIAFIHQDFIFNENPLEKLKSLSKNSIYGAVGMAFQPFYLQFKPKFILKIFRRCMLGQVYQEEDKRFVGNKVHANPKVKTLDCCCCIVHSSVLAGQNLKFDENLKFHMYVEDFCISAQYLNVSSRIVQFDACHLSGGKLNEELEKSAQYVKQKHNLRRLDSTCY